MQGRPKGSQVGGLSLGPAPACHLLCLAGEPGHAAAGCPSSALPPPELLCGAWGGMVCRFLPGPGAQM